MYYTPETEINERLLKLHNLLRATTLDGVFFHYKLDYYYLSGTMQNSLLFVPRDDDPILFVMREYGRARKESPLKRIIPIRSWKEIVSVLKPMKQVGLQLDVLPYNDVVRFRELLGSVSLVDISPFARQLRQYKSDFEISLMKRAANIAKKVYGLVPEVLREGMTEIELAGLLEARAKALGHEGLLRTRALNLEGYSWHVLSGSTGSIVSQGDAPVGGLGLSPAFPVGASLNKIKRNEPILVDFGICYHGYQIDQTRMFAIGSMPEPFEKAYNACREIHYRVLDKVLTGSTSKELFQYSLDLANQLGYEKYYLGFKHHKVRFLAHGIGLELSEPPFIAANHTYPLEANMVFAIEPKMVFPGKGACGIENTVLIKNGTYQVLTNTTEKIITI